MKHSFLLFFLLTGLAQAAEPLVFTAPPRGSAENEAKTYTPIAKLLSDATGKQIVYKHPGNWLQYQSQMRAGKYDLVFDGPHFVSWRIKQLDHEAIARIPGKLVFAVVVQKDNQKLKTVNDLGAKLVCGLAPPNLATLSLYNEFDNPLRQPQIREVNSFPEGFKTMLAGKRCQAAVMRDKLAARLNKEADNAGKIIWTSKGVANQGFSAGPKFTAEDKQKMRDALLSDQAPTQLKTFFDRFVKGKQRKLLPVQGKEYATTYLLLRDVHGFEINE
jgi:ABC-type phosphate/phosphonate transport system substrate-binding protein